MMNIIKFFQSCTHKINLTFEVTLDFKRHAQRINRALSVPYLAVCFASIVSWLRCVEGGCLGDNLVVPFPDEFT